MKVCDIPHIVHEKPVSSTLNWVTIDIFTKTFAMLQNLLFYVTEVVMSINKARTNPNLFTEHGSGVPKTQRTMVFDPRRRTSGCEPPIYGKFTNVVNIYLCCVYSNNGF